MIDRSTFKINGDKAELKFDYSNGLVISEIEYNGEIIKIEFNSCAFPNRVNENFPGKFKWKKAYKNSNSPIIGSAPVTATEIPLMKLGDLEISLLFCIAEGLLSDEESDLILGERFLRDIVAEIDYFDHVIRFYKADKWNVPKNRNNKLVYDIEMFEKVIPVIKDEIFINDNIEVEMAMADTGNNSAILMSSDLGKRLGIVEGGKNVQTIIAGGGSENKLLSGIVESIIIGGLELNDVPVYVSPVNSNQFLKKESWINIGNGILGNFVTTFALPHKKLILSQK